jgi:GTPase SAR1 family protein
MPRATRLIVVGEAAVGKTWLLLVYATGRFPSEDVPSVSETHRCKAIVNNREHSVHILDTDGQDKLMGARLVSYATMGVFLVCFSIADRMSFDNV